MRDIKFLKLTFLIVLFAGLQSCTSETQSDETKEDFKVNLNTLISEYNATNPMEDAQYYSGNIDFVVENNQVVMLQGAKDYKGSFILQIDNNFDKSKFENLSGSFEMAHFGRYMIVQNDNYQYYITVDHDTKPSDNFDKFQIFKPFGIIKLKDFYAQNAGKMAAAKMSMDEASCTCKSGYLWTDNDPGNDPVCQSGGQYASSCSQGNCSVSCSGTAYACCNP